MRVLRGIGPVVLGAAMAAVIVTGLVPGPVAAADPSMRIEPAIVKVPGGARFAVRVVQDAPVPVSGSQASITFDHTILQIESVTPGVAYAGAPIVVPADLGPLVEAANADGSLAQVAAAFLPPATVAPGPAEFLVVRFRAVGCGQTPLELPVGPADAAMIDGRQETYGDAVSITSASGQVTTCVAADEVTPTLDEMPVAATSTVGGPLALIAVVAGVLTVAVVGSLARRSRRQGPLA
jgi:hypothetical protein